MAGTITLRKVMATIRKIARIVRIVTIIISWLKPFFISLYITDSPIILEPDGR